VCALAWKKKGQIFSFERKKKLPKWMNSHCQNPSVILYDDYIRVYFNTRPKKNHDGHSSYPAFIDLNKEFPNKILSYAKKPIIDLGSIGCFDQHGCMAGNIIRHKDQLWLFYVGWSRCMAVPYNWSIGLAKSDESGINFKRMFKGPIIGAQFNEPYLQNGNYVIKESETKWHMWYSTGTDWFLEGHKYESRYVIVYASSTDGIHWKRNGQPIIPFAYKKETQTTPTVFKYKNIYHMIFSTRHSTNFRNSQRGYKLGYAYSEDMYNWHRDDKKIGIKLSKSGWDSEMMCYPHVCKVKEKILMFYCGNNFGADGFGYAELLQQ